MQRNSIDLDDVRVIHVPDIAKIENEFDAAVIVEVAIEIGLPPIGEEKVVHVHKQLMLILNAVGTSSMRAASSDDSTGPTESEAPKETASS